MRNGLLVDQNLSMGLAPCAAGSYRAGGNPQLLAVVRECLQVIFESDYEESIASVTQFVESFEFGDGTTISAWMEHALLKGRILEATAHWIRAKARILDEYIPSAQASQSIQAFTAELQGCFAPQGYYNDPRARDADREVIAQFIFSATVDLCGRDAAVLGSTIGGTIGSGELVGPPGFLLMAEWPSAMLALMVRTLEEMQAKVSKVVMQIYQDLCFTTKEDSQQMLTGFFNYFTVDTISGTLDVHETCEVAGFEQSTFRVNLIDSFGCLMKLLYHLEGVCQNAIRQGGAQPVLAVDFEGEKLCRSGPLCLVQMTCNDDPTLVYVLDVWELKQRAFTMSTPGGTSFKSILEDETIRKVWFDPRNDVDALYHQFGIMPQGIFDLQLAEVADRRSRGLNVHYVQGLSKCLSKCAVLEEGQKTFAETINTLGKKVFEPAHGGSYQVFKDRPLHPVIMAYSAHDSRYMLDLYHQYLRNLQEMDLNVPTPNWVERVVRASAQRARFCESSTYVKPTSEVPDYF